MDKTKTRSKTHKKSIIASFFYMLGEKVSAAISNSAIGHAASSYDKVNSSFENSVAYTSVRKAVHMDKLSKWRNSAAAAFDRSYIRHGMLSFTNALRHCTVRFYGVLMLTFSLYVVLMYLIRKFGMFYTASVSYLVVGAVMGLLSLPLLFEKEKTLGRIFLDSKFFSWLLFDYFELRYESFRDRTGPINKTSIAFIIGMALGCLTFFVSPAFILMLLAVMLYLYMSLVSPEASLLTLLFLLPMLSLFEHPTVVLCILVFFISFGYLMKLMRKKRMLHFGMLESLVFIFILCILFGGMRNASMSTSSESLVMTLLALGFFLALNLLRTKDMIKHAARTTALSGIICSAFGIAEYLFGMATLDWLDFDMFSSISGRAVAFFDNPNVLGIYLCICTPITLCVMSFSQERRKTHWFVGFCVVIACSVLTWSRGAWIGIAVSLLVMLSTTKHFFITVFSVLMCLPLASYIVPPSVTERLFSIGNLADSSTAYRLNIWRGCADMAAEYGLGGIGVGEGAFQRMYAQFAVAGAERAYHAHSLWLQILLMLGVCGLILFTVMMLFFIQRSLTALKYGTDKDMQMLLAASMSGVCGVLVCGLFDYSWYNYRVYFLFFAIMGLACACDRASRDTEGGLYE